MELNNNSARAAPFGGSLWVVIAMAMIILGVRIQLILMHGNHTPYWDDWGVGRRLAMYVDSGFDLSWIFALANEHRGAFTKLMHIGLFELNARQWDPFLGMLASAVLWTLAGVWMMWVAIKSRAEINSAVAISLIMFLWVYPLSLFNITSTIQAYLYFMILFVMTGFWLCCARPYSAKWIGGILLICTASLTAAGGSFAPVAVASVFFFLAYFDRDKRRSHLTTALTASIISVFTLSLILSQKLTGYTARNLEFPSFITTFFKVLSWPASNDVWAWVFFLSPILLLAYRISRDPLKASRLAKYVLMLASFNVMMAFSIGFARSFNKGVGPADRYFEFLALYCLSSFFALMLLQNKELRWGRKMNGILVAGWLVSFVSAGPYQLRVIQQILDERAALVPVQEFIISEYTIAEDFTVFDKRKFREVPFPYFGRLSKVLKDMQRLDILPYQFQVPKTKLTSSQGAFILSHIIDQKTRKYRNHDEVLTSYNIALGAQNAEGEYISPVFRSKRPFVMIPHTGYLGHEGLSLKLVGVTDGEVVKIEPAPRHSKYAQTWKEEIVRAPKDGYRIVATDASKTLFFNIAAPRSVGGLTYYAKIIMKWGEPLWKYSVLLLLFLLRHDIATVLRAGRRR
ncbi:MAG: hypothetical protein HKN85_13190 [Gammaproteobacteria bacterium]|nr:hypothetical protein [Gammaproteobacteria bacterium]